jgi:hypothetical protein
MVATAGTQSVIDKNHLLLQQKSLVSCGLYCPSLYHDYETRTLHPDNIGHPRGCTINLPDLNSVMCLKCFVR